MNSFILKFIAVISMLIDHIGYMFFPELTYLRIIGRLAFPIYAFFIVEGFFRTSDFNRYLRRLFFLAFISEIPFDIAFFNRFPFESYQNVFFTLATGLITLYLVDRFRNEDKIFLAAGSIILTCVLSEMLFFDYGCKGIGMILCFYFYRILKDTPYKYLMIFAFIAINLQSIQIFSVLALILVYFYNGKRGLNLKYLFYWIYPIHLALFSIIRYVESLGTF